VTGENIMHIYFKSFAAVVALCTPAALIEVATAADASDTTEMNSAMTDQDFLMTAAASDEFERRSGEIAQRRGQREEVRAFGQQLIEDHTRSTEMLTAAGQAAGLPAPAPVLHPGLQRKLQELEGVAAELFDQVFLQTQAEAHVDARQLMRTCIHVCNAEPLRDTAGEIVSVIQMHLSHTLHAQREFQEGST
jgi:putative membrane protein